MDEIKAAFNYLRKYKMDIPVTIYLKGIKIGAVKAGGNISGISSVYHDAITQSLIDYFEGGGSVSGPRNRFRQACTEAFMDAFNLGWTDGGGEYPIEDDAISWLDARVAQELGNIDVVFENAKQLRKDGEFDFFTWATARADGYTSALLAIYNAAALFVKGNEMLTWQLGNTETHCNTCSKLNGKRHKASWYIANNYIPRQPGAAMDCGGYHCDCSLTDKNGNEVTL